VFYSPIRTALFGLLIWAALWIVMPLTQVGRLEPGAMLYIVASYLCMFAGAAVAQRQLVPGRLDPPTIWNGPLRRRLFWGSAALGMLGLLLRLVDRLLIRGVEYGASALELREALSETSTSAAGILAALILPLCLIPLILLLASSERRNRWLLTFAGIVFIVPMIESFFQLSRSFMLLTTGIAFAAASLTLFGGKLLNRTLILTSLVGAVTVAIVSTLIFSARIEAGRRQLTDSIFDSAYAEFLQPNSFAWSVITSGSGFESFALLSILPNGMYYLSGAYEFSALWARPDTQQFAFGQLLFYPFVRVGYQLIGVDIQNRFDVETYVFRDGVWQTFFGPLWVDFGWFGPFVMIIFGVIIQVLSIRVRKGSLALLPLYTYLIIVVFFMPVINFLISGFGMLAITAFTLFAIYASQVDRDERVGVSGNQGLPVR
jgi:oligosaccharide repeat unit polymerase